MMILNQSVWCRPGVLRGILCVLLLNSLMLVSQAAGSQFEQREQVILSLLKQGDYEAAKERSEVAVAEAEDSSSTFWQAKFIFYAGMAHQMLGQHAAGGSRVRHYQSAAEAYERAVEMQPEYAAAHHNLGKVYRELGEMELAFSHLERAASLAGDHQLFYKESLANEYLAEGNWEEGSALMADVVAQQPQKTERRDRLIEFYLERDPQQIVALLDEIAQQGNTVAAQELTLHLLKEPAWNRDQKQELFAVLLESLAANASYTALKLDSVTDAALDDLAYDTELTGSVRLLRDIYRMVNTSGTPDNDLLRAVQTDLPSQSRVVAEKFEKLLASLGSSQLRRKNYSDAQAYLELAHAAREEPDLDVLIDLSEVYLKTAQYEMLNRLVDSVEQPLFRNKALAYDRGAMLEIYRYHRTLGMMYAMLEETGRKGTGAASAEFQLEHALMTAEIFNDQVTVDEHIKIDPRLVTMLGDTYRRQHDEKSSVRLRLDWYGKYMKSHDSAAAVRVFDSIDSARLVSLRDTTLAKRYHQLDLERRRLPR